MSLADRPAIEQAAMGYCGPAGVPCSIFLGRVPAPGEPLWNEHDRELAMEWRYEEDLKCPGCGQPRTESMANEEDAPAYEATVLRCHACKIAALETEPIDDKAALYSFVHKKVG